MTDKQLRRKRELERFLEESRIWRDQEAERVAACDRSIQKYGMDIEGLKALIELEKKQKDILTRGTQAHLKGSKDVEAELRQLDKKIEKNDADGSKA